ncbi:hypothetical protein P8935_22970 [Telmatobacter sp. DSM 110680]|uniref:Uncharacterized protein n=1 Tax=Telmatobacter sp. DSM 110680 TaxID=3036704 RepID=A0AAU7DI79_9BACT
MNEPSRDALIQEYLSALRILDLEAPHVLDPLATIVYRRHLLKRINELDRLSRNPAPGQDPTRKP